MEKNHLIWALVDNRTGNKNQILGILNELKIPHKIFSIEYNYFANFPNFFIQLFGGMLHLKSKRFNPPYPSIIISCGRRTFPVSQRLKSFIKSSPYIFHLMYPKYSMNVNSCNIIFTPTHDNILDKQNIFKTIGSPSIKKKQKEKVDFYFKKPLVSILIGGDHGRFTLKKENIELLVNETLKKLGNGSIFITTSRRTSMKVVKKLNLLKKKNKKIKKIFHPNCDKEKNPLFEILSISDEIIVTGDSISMISEACSYKKPVRIFFNNQICSKKHINFCNYIIKKGYAFPFDTLLKKCNKLKRLNTSKIISNKILNYIEHENCKN